MAIPRWGFDSNSSLGTFEERTTLSIPIPVFDSENLLTIETSQFDSTDNDVVAVYSNELHLYVKSNGLGYNTWQGNPPGFEQHSPNSQVLGFKIPRQRSIVESLTRSSTQGIFGVAINGVPFKSANSGITTTIGGVKYTENSVIYPVQNFFTDGSGIVKEDKLFFYQSDPTLLYTKDPTTHSPIIGYAFDGNPIYGPFSYSDPTDSTSNIITMETSYRLRASQRENGTFPDGTFIEDFEYVEGLGTLDKFNGRFCITPEYPGGIYAYFVTVDPNNLNLPRYPYIIGPEFFNDPILPNGGFRFPGDIDVSVISGKLPPGLRINGTNVVGTPFEVAETTDFKFVLRAKNKFGFSDRTYRIVITGPDDPIWVTPEGDLSIGDNNTFYILDNSFVDFQLTAIDNDIPTGQQLKYFLAPRGGSLPPGITLKEDGKLTGIVLPIIAADQKDRDGGNYDMNLYDKFAYDYGVRPYNGYDSFLYDNQPYDYSDPVRTPRKLNRYYQFIVRVTDGINFSDRRFRIFVVGDDHLRADNTIMQVGTGVFTSDVTYLRKPIWITSPYLGRRRANNYITILLEVFNSNTLQGPIGYVLDPVNDDGSPSILPPGMELNQITGTLYGDVPYQPAVTKTYKFTVRAVRYNPQSTRYGIERKFASPGLTNQTTIRLDNVTGIDIGSFVTSPVGTDYIAPGTTITAINSITKDITISRPLQNAASVGGKLLISVVTSSTRTFTLDIKGEVDSTIRFITDGNLGTIPANFNSELAIEAVTTVPGGVLNYKLIGGSLPPGLRLTLDGTIQGKVNQFATDDALGLTTFDDNTTTLDGQTTSVDRDYTFIVLAQDQFKFSGEIKIFKVSVITPNDLLYSNIIVKPFLPVEKRLELKSFFTNQDIFERALIYRPNDPIFGVQSELKVLLYPGIETVEAAKYVSALGRTSKKRFRFGSLKKAIAKIPGTNTILYEAVYVEVIDNMETKNGSVSENIKIQNLNKNVTVNQGRRDEWNTNDMEQNIINSGKDSLERLWLPDRSMTSDYTGQNISDENRSTIFGNSTSNIRKKLSEVGDTERNFLPLWMRTPQSFSGIAQGFQLAIVLCYCKPGGADRIMTNIRNLGLDFKKVNFTIDRIIIDSVSGETGDKYIAFSARKVING
jgi:hypothetical protein